MYVMYFNSHISKHHNLTKLLINLISDFFNLNKSLLPDQLDKSLVKLISQFKTTNYYLVEYPYVDKLFRDSYYLYYSSKYGSYNRNCIKVSIFRENVDFEDFRKKDSIEKLQSLYYGFFVIRPTDPYFLGRNHIHPKAFKIDNFDFCFVNVNSTVNLIKLEVSAFPHASQDRETHSCAETTVWAIMEYFATKYPEYKTVKPSLIHSLLRQMAYERQIPSNGLSVNQISFALKELGFGCKVYGKKAYGAEFEIFLDMYINGGIPVIAGMDDFDEDEGNKIGHAVIIIGKKQKQDEFNKFKHLKTHQQKTISSKQITLFDLNNTDSEYVFIDDNHPPYQLAGLDKPVEHYSDLWKNVKLKHFIVPLYSKIYLEAAEARNFTIEFLINSPFPLETCSTVCLNIFPASSRTFKHSLALSSVNNDLKGLILERPMPKFIWVVEMGSKEEIKAEKRSGLLILDATEPNIDNNKPIIIGAYQNNVVFFKDKKKILTKLSLPFSPFKVFLKNLKTMQ